MIQKCLPVIIVAILAIQNKTKMLILCQLKTESMEKIHQIII